MAMPPPYQEEKPIKPYKKCRDSSLLVYVFSIVVSVSIFYVVFNLSPSTTFLKNNKFWFFISNTLILIIAADYGAFSCSSSSKEIDKPDLYEEYVIMSNSSRPKRRSSVFTPPFVSQYPAEMMAPKSPTSYSDNIPKEEVIENLKEDKTNIKITNKKNSGKSSDSKIAVNSEEEKSNDENFREKPMKGSEKEENHEITYKRSKFDSESRSGTEYWEEVISEEENEFSRMSNEELNKRVEEFIQKFNRQIRLQRAPSCHNI